MKPLLYCLIVLLSSNFAHAGPMTNRTYKQSVDFIHQLAAKYPQNSELFVIGYSNEGIAIEGIKLGHGNVHDLVVSTHHGNEYGSTEVALAFAESVAQAPLNGITMYVVPVLNIDGYNNRDRYERANGSPVDPNRDYPGPCGTEGPYNLRSTHAMADFIAKENIVASATLHTHWPAVMYPWGISTHDLETPYTPIFMNMVQVATANSHYAVGNSTEVLYPADGAFEDYAFWKHGIWSILFELGNSHTPSVSDVQTTISNNVPSMRKMFEVAPKTRAENHDFKGKCDTALRLLDMHIE